MKRHILIAVITIVVLLVYAFTLYKISRSRTFQLFGNLVYRVETDRKIIALTFDDCPNENLAKLLNVLKTYTIPATFYVPGKCLLDDPSSGKLILSQGHELGNHSFSHKRMVFKSLSFIADEVSKTNQLIRDLGYTGDVTFRPPNGKKLILLPYYLQQHDITTVMWDVEPDTYNTATNIRDYEAFTKKYILTNTRPGSILLLHPFCDLCEGNINALPEVINELKQRGYEFVTITNLLKETL